MDWVFRAMAVFIEHPLLAAVIGILLVTLGRVLHRRLTTVAGVMWLMYSLWEFGIKQRWLCRGDRDIRGRSRSQESRRQGADCRLQRN